MPSRRLSVVRILVVALIDRIVWSDLDDRARVDVEVAARDAQQVRAVRPSVPGKLAEERGGVAAARLVESNLLRLPGDRFEPLKRRELEPRLCLVELVLRDGLAPHVSKQHIERVEQLGGRALLASAEIDVIERRIAE